jgi:hypothetical protein
MEEVSEFLPVGGDGAGAEPSARRGQRRASPKSEAEVEGGLRRYAHFGDDDRSWPWCRRRRLASHAAAVAPYTDVGQPIMPARQDWSRCGSRECLTLNFLSKWRIREETGEGKLDLWALPS